MATSVRLHKTNVVVMAVMMLFLSVYCGLVTGRISLEQHALVKNVEKRAVPLLTQEIPLFNRTKRGVTWVPPEFWHTYVDKGSQLLCLMEATTEAADTMLQANNKGPSQGSWTD